LIIAATAFKRRIELGSGLIRANIHQQIVG